MKKYSKYIIGMILLMSSISVGVINGNKHGYNLIPQSSTEWIYILVAVILFLIGVILSYMGVVQLDNDNTVEVQFNDESCGNCRFGGDNCTVGTYLAEQGKNGVCYEGELWQSKD